MKKNCLALALAVCLATGAAVTGCSLGSATQGTSHQQAAASATSATTVKAGTVSATASSASKKSTSSRPVLVSTRYGKLKVTVDGFVTNAAVTEDCRTSPMFGDDSTAGMLLLTVENVSYHDPDAIPDDTVELGKCVKVNVGGKAPSLLDFSLAHDGYESAYQGKVQCFSAGTTLKCNLAYELTDVPSEVCVTVGDAQVMVPVSVE